MQCPGADYVPMDRSIQNTNSLQTLSPPRIDDDDVHSIYKVPKKPVPVVTTAASNQFRVPVYAGFSIVKRNSLFAKKPEEDSSEETTSSPPCKQRRISVEGTTDLFGPGVAAVDLPDTEKRIQNLAITFARQQCNGVGDIREREQQESLSVLTTTDTLPYSQHESWWKLPSPKLKPVIPPKPPTNHVHRTPPIYSNANAGRPLPPVPVDRCDDYTHGLMMSTSPVQYTGTGMFEMDLQTRDNTRWHILSRIKERDEQLKEQFRYNQLSNRVESVQNHLYRLTSEVGKLSRQLDNLKSYDGGVSSEYKGVQKIRSSPTDVPQPLSLEPVTTTRPPASTKSSTTSSKLRKKVFACIY